ncbi:AbfB domain-containing protein [Nonomuraea helvata]|uniref:AbfB domain-containing protein n=1 Tax=Nonomuraea helvata TaxID=37484 RepID=A0ABV5SJ46_9ACTN
MESVNHPGRFVRRSDDRLRLDKAEDTALFRADSSFRPVTPS